MRTKPRAPRHCDECGAPLRQYEAFCDDCGAYNIDEPEEL